jgi:hypothetical protein
LPRSCRDLIVENALLRQQLLVLRQQVKRPRLTIGDRIRLICLARFTRFWASARHLVQPDTLLRWHRDLFGHYWRWKSTSKARKPRIAQETSDLLKRMTADASENRLWGAERIRGELLKLGLKVSQRTARYLIRDRDKKYGRRFAAVARSASSKELKTPIQAPWPMPFASG